MRKIFLKKHKNNGYYSMDEYLTINFDLYHLKKACELYNEEIIVDEYGPGITNIWCEWDIRQSSWGIRKKLATNEQEQQFQNYFHKKWDDMPILYLTTQNYEQVLDKWKRLIKEKPNFIVFAIDDHGVVTVQGKEALDEQDWFIIKSDHEKHLNFTRKQEAYFATHPRSWNKKWLSPADSEFFSDYLTEDEMVWKQTHALYKKKS